MLWLKGKTSDVEAIRQYIISLHIVWQLSECKHCGMPNRNEWTALSLSLYEETHQPILYNKQDTRPSNEGKYDSGSDCVCIEEKKYIGYIRLNIYKRFVVIMCCVARDIIRCGCRDCTPPNWIHIVTLLCLTIIIIRREPIYIYSASTISTLQTKRAGSVVADHDFLSSISSVIIQQQQKMQLDEIT